MEVVYACCYGASRQEDFFHLWYSYWLEEMVFILNNKAAFVLRSGALIAAVLSFLLIEFPALMSLCGLVFFGFLVLQQV